MTFKKICYEYAGGVGVDPNETTTMILSRNYAGLESRTEKTLIRATLRGGRRGLLRQHQREILRVSAQHRDAFLHAASSGSGSGRSITCPLRRASRSIRR